MKRQGSLPRLPQPKAIMTAHQKCEPSMSHLPPTWKKSRFCWEQQTLSTVSPTDLRMESRKVLCRQTASEHSLTLWVEQDLKLQKCTSKKLKHIFHPKQFKDFSDRKVEQGKLIGTWSLADYWPIDSRKLQRSARRGEWHLIEYVVYVALKG